MSNPQPPPPGSDPQQPYGQPTPSQASGQPPYGQQPQQPYGTPYQYPPSPYGAPPPNWTQYPPPPTGNGKAITAFVFGILSVLLFWTTVFDIVPVLLAVIFGAIAMSDAKRTGQPRGMAMTGFILGIVGAIAAVMFTVFVYAKVKDCFDNYSSGSTEFNSCIDDKLNF